MGVTIAALYTVAICWVAHAHERVYGPRDYVQVTRLEIYFLSWGPAKSSIILHSDWATYQATSAFGGKFDIPTPHDKLEGKS